MPAAAEGFDQSDGGDEALAGDLMHAAFCAQSGAAGIDDFEERAAAGFVTDDGEPNRFVRGVPGAVLRGGLLTQIAEGGKLILHIAQGCEDALTIERERLVMRRAVAFKIG